MLVDLLIILGIMIIVPFAIKIIILTEFDMVAVFIIGIFSSMPIQFIAAFINNKPIGTIGKLFTIAGILGIYMFFISTVNILNRGEKC